MAKRSSDRIKVFRKGEIVDRNSTEIRADQREKLTKERTPQVKQVSEGDRVKLITKTPEIV